MSTLPPRETRAIDRVRDQRDRLRDAHAAFDQACDQPERSVAAARDALDAVRDAFAAHVAYAEGPDGLFEEMRDDAPGDSATEVDRLRRDHITITNALDRVGEFLRSDGATLDDERVKEPIAELTRLLAQHRRRGMELTYNIYGVDIGGGD
jgi:hypothetical protein